jgi:hypothetical protein
MWISCQLLAFNRGACVTRLQVLRDMLAADARAEGAPGSGKAAQGRDEIVRNMQPILAQIQGNIQEVRLLTRSSPDLGGPFA